MNVLLIRHLKLTSSPSFTSTSLFTHFVALHSFRLQAFSTSPTLQDCQGPHPLLSCAGKSPSQIAPIVRRRSPRHQLSSFISVASSLLLRELTSASLPLLAITVLVVTILADSPCRPSFFRRRLSGD
ncbi:hypothetical protein HN51_009322 [Arachis hypogaea]